MKRIILSLLLCASFLLPLFSQEVLVETYENNVDLWIILPYELFILSQTNPFTEYQITVQLKNNKARQVSVNEYTMQIPNHSWLADCAIPIKQSQALSAGAYSLNLILRNKVLGDKRNYARYFEVKNQATEIGAAFLLAERAGFEYIPSTMDMKKLTKLTLKQSFGIPASKIALICDNARYDVENPASPFQINIKDICASDSLQSFEVMLTEENIGYKNEGFLYKPWFSYSLKYSVKDQMAQLRYIANQNEWKVLRKVPKDTQNQAIESFWQAKDPSPGTIRNELRERFYQLVLKADDQFSVHKTMPGWKSDRGRIYIKYGDPDQIVNDAFPVGKAPSITWHYYRLNTSFIFTDERGFGQYTLRNKDDEYLDN